MTAYQIALVWPIGPAFGFALVSTIKALERTNSQGWSLIISTFVVVCVYTVVLWAFFATPSLLVAYFFGG